MSHVRRVAIYGSGKLVSALMTMLVLATIVFILLRMIPGDEALVVAGGSASASELEEIRRRLGLDGSVLHQYLSYLGRLLHGDLGVSNTNHAPVLDSILDVLPSTAELVVMATAMIASIAMPLAALSALRKSSSGDTARRVLVIVASGLPAFWLALVLQRVLASDAGIFPISGTLSWGMSVPTITGATTLDALLSGNGAAALDSIWHLILPAFALALPYVGQLFRVVRAETLRVSTRVHITVARSVGVRRGRLIRSHIMPQVLTPALSIIGVEFGALFAGAVLVESIYGRPGIGSFLMSALANKDSPSILGGVLVVGFIVIVTNYVVDIAQVVRDPRVRYAELGI